MQGWWVSWAPPALTGVEQLQAHGGVLGGGPHGIGGAGAHGGQLGAGGGGGRIQAQHQVQVVGGQQGAAWGQARAGAGRVRGSKRGQRRGAAAGGARAVREAGSWADAAGRQARTAGSARRSTVATGRHQQRLALAARLHSSGVECPTAACSPSGTEPTPEARGRPARRRRGRAGGRRVGRWAALGGQWALSASSNGAFGCPSLSRRVAERCSGQQTA